MSLLLLIHALLDFVTVKFTNADNRIVVALLHCFVFGPIWKELGLRFLIHILLVLPSLAFPICVRLAKAFIDFIFSNHQLLGLLIFSIDLFHSSWILLLSFMLLCLCPLLLFLSLGWKHRPRVINFSYFYHMDI